VVSVAVVITVLLDNNRLVTTVPIPNVVTIAIAIAIPVTMDFTHRHAMRPDTDSDFLGSGWNCAAKTHRDGYCDCVFQHYCAPMDVITLGSIICRDECSETAGICSKRPPSEAACSLATNAKGVCAEITFKQRDEIMIRFNRIGS
jgi:hypothetical protein